MNEELSGIQRKGKHFNNFEDVSDLKDMEEGEIRQLDNPEVTHIKAETACPIYPVENDNQVNPFKVPPPPSELRVFRKKQNLNLKKMMKNQEQTIGSMDLSNNLPKIKRMKSILIRRSSVDNNMNSKFVGFL